MAKISDEDLKKMCGNGYKKALGKYIEHDKGRVWSNARWLQQSEDTVRTASRALEGAKADLLKNETQMKRIEELGL